MECKTLCGVYPWLPPLTLTGWDCGGLMVGL